MNILFNIALLMVGCLFHFGQNFPVDDEEPVDPQMRQIGSDQFASKAALDKFVQEFRGGLEELRGQMKHQVKEVNPQVDAHLQEMDHKMNNPGVMFEMTLDAWYQPTTEREYPWDYATPDWVTPDQYNPWDYTTPDWPTPDQYDHGDYATRDWATTDGYNPWDYTTWDDFITPDHGPQGGSVQQGYVHGYNNVRIAYPSESIVDPDEGYFMPPVSGLYYLVAISHYYLPSQNATMAIRIQGPAHWEEHIPGLEHHLEEPAQTVETILHLCAGLSLLRVEYEVWTPDSTPFIPYPEGRFTFKGYLIQADTDGQFSDCMGN